VGKKSGRLTSLENAARHHVAVANVALSAIKSVLGDEVLVPVPDMLAQIGESVSKLEQVLDSGGQAEETKATRKRRSPEKTEPEKTEPDKLAADNVIAPHINPQPAA